MINIKKEKLLIKPSDIEPSSDKFEVIGTINPAAVRMPNGEIVLYVRVIEKLVKSSSKGAQYSPKFIGEEKFRIKIDKFENKSVENWTDLDFSFENGTKRLKFISHFRRVVLDKSGFRIKLIEKNPSFFGLRWDGELGVEDPRITKIGELYVMTYVALTKEMNVSTNYAVSNDCLKWYRRGIAFGEQNKDVVILPELIGGEYVAFNRPEGNFQFSLPDITISYSKDLEYWGRPTPFKIAKEKSWDSGRVGAGPPPIKTKKGWLLIYHGVIEKHIKQEKHFKYYLEKFLGKKERHKIRDIYCAGAALLDLKDPRKIIAKSEKPILLPTKKYEKGTFEFKDVVFPTGMILGRNEEDVLIFSGGGDINTTVKKISLKEIFRSLKRTL